MKKILLFTIINVSVLLLVLFSCHFLKADTFTVSYSDYVENTTYEVNEYSRLKKPSDFSYDDRIYIGYSDTLKWYLTFKSDTNYVLVECSLNSTDYLLVGSAPIPTSNLIDFTFPTTYYNSIITMVDFNFFAKTVYNYSTKLVNGWFNWNISLSNLIEKNNTYDFSFSLSENYEFEGDYYQYFNQLEIYTDTSPSSDNQTRMYYNNTITNARILVWSSGNGWESPIFQKIFIATSELDYSFYLNMTEYYGIWGNLDPNKRASFSDVLMAIADTPFKILYSLTNFSLLGTTLFGIICAVLTVLIAIFIFKKFK